MRRPLRLLAAGLLAALPLAAAGGDGAALARAFPALSFVKPLFLAAAPGEARRLYVVTQGGRIFRFDRGDPQRAEVFLDLSARVTQRGGEEGLLGLAFHPDFARNRAFYVYYTPADDPRRTVLSRLTARDGASADLGSERVLLTIAQPYANHNGGMLAFGPDRRLYIGVGDGGAAGDPHGNGQNLGALLGKILRVDDDGRAVADNPFVGTPGARGEIWAYGVRNPWRFSFDRLTGALWLADVGQNRWEEVDVVARGGNYGWNVYEGAMPYRNPDRRPPRDFAAPVFTYGHDAGCSITGGYVYRGRAVPALVGRYVYADYCSGRVWALRYEDGQVRGNRPIGTVPSPTSFGEDADGELYVTSFDGHLYRIEAAP